MRRRGRRLTSSYAVCSSVDATGTNNAAADADAVADADDDENDGDDTAAPVFGVDACRSFTPL
jgi:hypothetical protein